MVAPGLFGNNSATAAEQAVHDERLVAKLDAYWNWAAEDDRIIGFSPYMWADSSPCTDALEPNRSKGCWLKHTCYERAPGSGPCGRPGELFGFGAQHYPKVVARLREIGAIVHNNAKKPTPPPVPPMPPPPPTPASPDHAKIFSFYGDNTTAQQGIVNVRLTGVRE